MPVVPSALERAVFLHTKQGPAPLLDIVAMMAFRATVGAVNLGLLDALERGPLAAGEVARRIEADERATQLMLDAMVELGYVRTRRRCYELTPMAAKWLPLVRDGVPFAKWMVEEWEHLEEVVRDPSAWRDEKATWTEDKWRIFQAGMVAFASLNVREVVRHTPVPPGARRMLDLGGGHGLYSVELARAHPHLRAVVFDAPEVEPHARRTIDGAGMAARVDFRAGDFWHDEIGTGYDLVFIGNVVHGYQPDENRKLFEIVARALAPHGHVVILDGFPGGRRIGKVGPALAALMAINMYISAQTQTYPAADVAVWLEGAGFIAPKVKRLLRSPGLGLVTAAMP